MVVYKKKRQQGEAICDVTLLIKLNQLQYNFSGSNTDGSFTMAVSNLCWSPQEISQSSRTGKIKSDFSFYIENGMLCVLIRIASMRRF